MTVLFNKLSFYSKKTYRQLWKWIKKFYMYNPNRTVEFCCWRGVCDYIATYFICLFFNQTLCSRWCWLYWEEGVAMSEYRGRSWADLMCEPSVSFSFFLISSTRCTSSSMFSTVIFSPWGPGTMASWTLVCSSNSKISVFWTVFFFFFLMKQQRATERNARKNRPPSETKTTIITVEWCPGVGGGGGITWGGGGMWWGGGGWNGWVGGGVIGWCGGGGTFGEGGVMCGGGKLWGGDTFGGDGELWGGATFGGDGGLLCGGGRGKYGKL